jgi:MYXO-CTERM domain-containing protein
MAEERSRRDRSGVPGDGPGRGRQPWRRKWSPEAWDEVPAWREESSRDRRGDVGRRHAPASGPADTLARGGPRGRRLPWPSTLLLTVFVLGGTRFAALGQPDRAGLDPFAVGLLLVAAVLLLWRHRYPGAVAVATAGTVLLYLGAGYPYGPVPVTVAVAGFTAVVHGRRAAAWSAVGGLWAGHLLLVHWWYRHLPPSGDGPMPWPAGIGTAAWALAVLALAELVRVRREQWARERAQRAQAERYRADEERLRIARELHDVLAHSISVINVQAGVGLALLDSDPEQARTALSTIKTASKEALGEVRQVLDTLRAPGAAPRAPAPGLDRLPELVEQAARTGLTVTVTVEPESAEPAQPALAHPAPEGPAPEGPGPQDPAGRNGAAGAGAVSLPDLPPGLDLAAFRIVQEALTNVVRHSGSRRARVRVSHRDRALELLVDDDGPATGGDAGGGGRGLVGMRERAAALGGTLEAGPGPGGGFRVRATLPLSAPEPHAPGAASGEGRGPRGEAR